MKTLNKTTLAVIIALTFSGSNFVIADTATTTTKSIPLNPTVNTTPSHTINTSNTNTTTNTTVTKTLPDSEITSKVKAEFSKSKILNDSDIKIITKNGVVYLSGIVDTNTQYSEAVSTTEATAGVNNVNVQQLTVKGSKYPLQDTYVTAKIKGAFIKASLTGTDVSLVNTHVETKNGIVYLSGKLDNPKQVINAIQIAKNIEGVKSVKSTLVVK